LAPVNPWKTLGSRLVYESPWLRLREDQVVRPDGEQGIYGVVELPPSVAIVALNARDEVLIVGQWRYTHQKFSWEIPTGSSEPGEAILDAAKRELREEGGVLASAWMPLGSIDNSNGVTTDVSNLFLATGLQTTDRDEDPTEQLTVRWIPFARAVADVMSGAMTECGTVSGILKAHLYRSRSV
jgi:8-oxo-dGTP pyrophosphatase MutT (NUDIX family)